jgi:hypothetical protein
VRPALEVTGIFRAHGPAWRQHAHLSRGQHNVMSAIEQCRSAALDGHVLHCQSCEHDEIAYNSCRNRHCPKCQDAAARRWLLARQTDIKTMTLSADEFTRRFLLHVLPGDFHRIRHYGLNANSGRKENLARARELVACRT